MSKCENLIGERFGHWVVIARSENSAYGSARWKCSCDCGTTRVIGAQPLKSGKSKSCGCHKNDYNRKHGGKGTKLYEVWRSMRYRCENPNNQAYPMYGARGIRVCAEWKDFASFREWALSNGYENGLSIDRIDVNGNYEPSNCRWTDCKTQMNNRRNTPHFEYGGKSMTISEWSQALGIPRSTILNRLKRGWSFDKAINTTYASKQANEARHKKSFGELL